MENPLILIAFELRAQGVYIVMLENCRVPPSYALKGGHLEEAVKLP